MTSIRDIAVHGDDLVIATHGRAFWVMDDIAPLRQAARCATTLQRAARIFSRRRPRIACVRETKKERRFRSTSRRSTTPDRGLYIDYYLPDAPRTPVVIEVLDAGGSVVRRWSSAQPPKPVDPKSLDYTPHWVAAASGAVGGGRRASLRLGFPRGLARRTACCRPERIHDRDLNVNGRRTTRTARVLRDPRIAASDADLRAQYELARRIAALTRRRRGGAREAGQQIEDSLRSARARYGRRSSARTRPTIPTIRWAAYSHDFTSFLYLENALDYLESAVESADAAPTPDMRTAYAKLDAIYRQTLARFEATHENQRDARAA